MAGISEIRKGVVIKHQNDLYVVKGFNFVNPGKGSAFSKVKMKSIMSGKTIEITYKSSESVEIVEVSHQRVQYLYKSGQNYTFMNPSDYEMIELTDEDLGEDARFLKDGLEVDAVMYNDRVIAVELPKKIQYTVKDAPPAVKGDTASGRVMKEVIMDNGLVTRAPAFVKPGDVILVNTETNEYCERVNS